jgi:hypothetical protein
MKPRIFATFENYCISMSREYDNGYGGMISSLANQLEKPCFLRNGKIYEFQAAVQVSGRIDLFVAVFSCVDDYSQKVVASIKLNFSRNKFEAVFIPDTNKDNPEYLN